MKNDILQSFLQKGEEFRVLFRQLSERTHSHAYLITGEKGTGKRTLARLMGAALLCSSAGNRPCGSCKNCVMAEKGEHPDLIVIGKGNPIAPSVKKDRATIPVEDLREMIRLFGIRSTEGNMRAALIFDADKMTVQAQNCLLKTLEEPPTDTCIILVTDHPESLLPTIISRCRTFHMKPWEDSYILSLLDREGIAGKRASETASLANGSIGQALELAADESFWELREEILNSFFHSAAHGNALKVSGQWKDRKQDAERILSILESFVRMLSEARFSPGLGTDLSIFPEQWQRFSAKTEISGFTLLTDSITEARKQLQYSVNFQAVLERLILSFTGEGNKWRLS